jgi:hypothetical protein
VTRYARSSRVRPARARPHAIVPPTLRFAIHVHRQYYSGFRFDIARPFQGRVSRG